MPHLTDHANFFAPRMRAPPHSVAKQPERIFIPQEARGQPIAGFQLSNRLRHILLAKRFKLLADIHDIAIDEFITFRNCGQKTLQELVDFVRNVQLGLESSKTDLDQAAPPNRLNARCFVVAGGARDFKPSELPISARLEGVLRKKGVARLADLHGISPSELLSIDNCGKKTINELVRLLERAAAGEFNPALEPFSTADSFDVICWIETFLATFSPRDREVLLLRLAAEENRVWTLEEIGARSGLTRERVRQIVEKLLSNIRKMGGPRLMAQLEGTASACYEMVCPLTPALLIQWVAQRSGTFRFPPAFHVRLMGELKPGIPVWPKGQEPSPVRLGRSALVLKALEQVLLDNALLLPLRKAFELTASRIRGGDLSEGEFLSALKYARTVIVRFPLPDQPEVRLRRLRVTYVAREILESSDGLLTPEEIISRSQEKFGGKFVEPAPQSLANALTPAKGFYLLGPRSYGLRRHFTLPECMWESARTDCQKFLDNENRPISASEIVSKRFRWAEQTNAYELAQILREDERFIDLGRFLFGLAAWGNQERQHLGDLVLRILAEAERPMTAAQVFERLQKFRSVSAASLPTTMRTCPGIRDYGFGHYGLLSWGESVKVTVAADTALVERVIRRSDPPLSFNRLCDILEIPEQGAPADRLWQTCASLPAVVCIPAEYNAHTYLAHKSCTLERALVATARAVDRPLPVYELQWELNARFGPLFERKSSTEIRRSLEQSPLFLRNIDDEFILDVHLDQLDLDQLSIRRACLEILSQANEIVGCDDLIERLDTDGKVREELSPDILGSVLREDQAFQEVGHNRFRTRPCKC